MMISIELHHRTSSRGMNYAGSLFIRVIYSRKSANITLPYSLYPEEWDRHRKRVCWENVHKSRVDYLNRVERETVRVMNTLHQITDRLQEQGEFTSQKLVSEYRMKTRGYLLFPFAQNLCKKMKDAGKTSSVRSYKTALGRLEQFAGHARITFSDLTAQFLLSFEEHLRKDGMKLNTISAYMRSLRAIYNKAVASGKAELTGENPFAKVYTGVEQTRKRALTGEEISRISRQGEVLLTGVGENTEQEGLQKARSYFLFAFLAQGMSFVDMAYLKKENIRGKIICYRRRKTGQQVIVSITPELHKLIQRFADQVKDSPYVLPIISRPGDDEWLQYESALRLQNKWLKKLGKELSTHVARHTWATIARQKNLPVALISECLGHTSEKTTRIYLGAFEPRVLAEANRRVTCIFS